MHTRPPLESDDYLHRLVRCNEALGDCLGFPIRTASDVEKAYKCLKERTWPPDSPGKALASEVEFPWLPGLFAPRAENQPPPRVVVWEELAEDLFAHPRYGAWLYQRAGRYVEIHSPPKPPRGSGKGPTPGDRAVDAVGGVLWRAFLIAAGKAAYCLEKRQQGSDKTWLDLALDFSRSVVGRVIRDEETGVQRQSKPSNKAAPDEPTGLARLRVLLESDVFPPGSEGARPPEPETDRDELPDARASERERDAGIWAALDRLPPEQRQVVQLRFLEGRSWDDTAREMGTTPCKAKQVLRQAIKRLRRELHDERDEP